MPRRRTAWTRLLPFAGVALLLASCSLFPRSGESGDEQAEHKTQQEAEAELSNSFIEGLALDPLAEKRTVGTSEELARIDNGTDEELTWTDPEDPNAGLSELNTALENRRKGNGWLSDLNIGARFARREGRPLIVWIHDSVISPKSKQLGRELLETEQFLKWCENRVVCVKLDAGTAIDEKATGRRMSLSAVQALQKRFGVSKRPALVVLSPQGKIMERVDGYNGYTTEVEISLRNGVILAEDANKEYRTKLKAKGYRDWTLKNGDKLFAKLQRLDEKKNIVYLKAAGGKISRTKLAKFCQADVEYLDELARSGKAPK